MNTLDQTEQNLFANYLPEHNRLVLRLPKTMNYQQILAMEEAGDKWIQQPCAVVVDAGNLQQMDSAVIGTLLHTKNKLDLFGGEFYLYNVNDQILELNRRLLNHHFVLETGEVSLTA